jgi:hypothetical protein
MEVLAMKVLGKALALVLVAALACAGTATAAKLVTGSDIAKRTIKGSNIKKGAIGPKLLSGSAKASLAGVPGPQGEKGDPGEPGSADRYAFVRSDGLLQNETKGITQDQVSHPSAGIYCFSFPAGGVPKGGAATGGQESYLYDTLATLMIDSDGGMSGCPVTANVRVVTWDVSAGTRLNRGFRLLLEDD